MVNFSNIFNFLKSKKNNQIISVHDLPQYNAYAGQTRFSNYDYTVFDGEKFPGGFGVTQLLDVDYWTLRKRSQQLFKTNLYASGLINRLVTNEINTGLCPEARPDEEIIGVPENSLDDWTETIENRFSIWAENPFLCDYYHKNTFAALQRQARIEALINGDVLVVNRKNSIGLPAIQLISSDKVRTPLNENQNIPKSHRIKHGVEYDGNGRIYAYWVCNTDDGTYERLLAYGSRSKRRIAWLLFGTSKLLDDVRGQPLLSVVLQSLQEIDRYRDSTQRKATINSMIASFIEKSQDKISSLPIQGGATRKDSVSVTDNDGKTRNLKIAGNIPGMVIEELQTGETIKSLGGQGTDTSFAEFEETIIQAVAWANEMPPEILRLAFSNNYSASQAAINEFKIYLNKIWGEFGESFCKPIYTEWLLSETLLQKIYTGNMLDAWRDPMQYDVFGAWIGCDWYGSIKPSTDMLKQAKGSLILTENGWSTNAREARITTGTKFSKNIKRLKRENEMKAEAMQPLIEMQKQLNSNSNMRQDIDDIIDNLTS